MRTIAILAFAGLCAGCVTTGESIRFQAKGKQETLMRDGRAALVSKAKNSTVTILPAARQIPAGGRPIFVVRMKNNSRVPLEFRVDAVEVVQGNQGLRVFTYEELAGEERNRQVASTVLVGVAAGINSAEASRHGWWAERAVARDNERLANQVAKAGKRSMVELEKSAIKDHTLLAGETYGGQIHISPPAGEGAKTYAIRLMVGSDRHDIEVVHEGTR
jgi:hypothetical protein